MQERRRGRASIVARADAARLCPLPSRKASGPAPLSPRKGPSPLRPARRSNFWKPGNDSVYLQLDSVDSEHQPGIMRAISYVCRLNREREEDAIKGADRASCACGAIVGCDGDVGQIFVGWVSGLQLTISGIQRVRCTG
jgi:hypothetical protein